MKTLRNYITTAFLSTLLLTVVVLTFVVSIGGLFKLTDLVTKGVPPGPIFGVFLSGLPQALSFAIPVSAITATLLVFGRLSADSEITAMRACGIGLWRITSWMMPVALVLMLACVYINSEMVPHSHFARRAAVTQLGVINPVELIDEGRTIRDFDGLSLYVERKKGDTLLNVRIFDQREEGRTREIKAERGEVSMPADSGDLLLSLEQVTVDPFSFDRPGKADAARWLVRIADARRTAYYRRRDKDMTLVELYTGAQALRATAASNRSVRIAGTQAAVLRECAPGDFDGWCTNCVAVASPGKALASGEVHVGRLSAHRFARGHGIWEGMEEQRSQAMRMMVEFHKRLALASSAFAFVFLGVPLGIRSHRKESSLGIGLGLLVVYLFYMFIMLAGQLASRPEFRPDLLNWVPVMLALVLGAWMIRRLR